MYQFLTTGSFAAILYNFHSVKGSNFEFLSVRTLNVNLNLQLSLHHGHISSHLFSEKMNSAFFWKFSFYFDPLIYRYEISFHNIFQRHCEITLFLYNCQRHCEITLFFVFFPKSWNSAFLKIQLFSICLCCSLDCRHLVKW